MGDNRLTPEDIEFVRNLLRQGSVKWKGRADCLRRARKRVLVRRTKSGQPVYKYHWQCAHCLQWTNDVKKMEVDHIVEIGAFSGDWNLEIKKVFPRPEWKHLQALCIVCHLKKTKAFNSARSRWKRKSI